MEFLFPLAFILLPLPFIVRRVCKPAPLAADGSLRVPFYQRLVAPAENRGTASMHRPWRLLMASVIWVLLITALARPVFVGEEIELPLQGRDLMLAIDLSASMAQEDFAVDGRRSNRLAVVKAAANDFIQRRSGDRIGLILFSDRAYLQAPLTLDRSVVSALLDEAEVGLTGRQTAIGDAIAIAVKRLKDRPAKSRVLILLTDGASNVGVLEPLQAAQFAKDLRIRIYTIGVGAQRALVRTPFGSRIVNPSEGLDEKTLLQIARLTGGQYFRAQDVKSLANIYAELDSLEPASADSAIIRPSIGLFVWPLSAAVLLAALLAMSLLMPLRGGRRLQQRFYSSQ